MDLYSKRVDCSTKILNKGIAVTILLYDYKDF